MAKRTTLPDSVKTFIVMRLACYDKPQEIAEAVRSEFDIEIGRNRVHEYDVNGYRGDRLAQKWKDLFAETRKAFLEDTSRIAIANKAVRLQRLERMVDKAEQMKNLPLAAQLIEQISKECGGMYTTKRQHELSAPGGGPIQSNTRMEVVFVDPDEGGDAPDG